MSVLRLLSGTVLVGVCVLGAGCGTESGDDATAGSGGQAGMPSGAGAGGGSGGASGGTGGGAGKMGSGGVTTGGAAGSAGSSSGSSGNGGSAGMGNADLPDIDPNKRIADLTDQEKAELCDWMVGLFGGYGVTTQCPAGSVQTYPSQELCVTAGLSFRCDTVTVGDVEACELSMVPSGGCDSSDPSCDALHCT